ncbi:4813_t:CDS:2, partial [Cetraspora pellucida]
TANLIATRIVVAGAGVIFSWALANQPDNNSVEIKQSEVIAD